MPLKKIPTLIEGPNGWTDWVTPRSEGYVLACCDCSLAHDMQFMVRLKGGRNMDRRNGQIKFRLRRNKEYTARLRREKKS
jgi:hypothetical protein